MNLESWKFIKKKKSFIPGSKHIRPSVDFLNIVLLLNSLCPGLQPTRLLCPWDFPGNNAGVGYHFLLLGFFPTQGSNLRLLHWHGDSLPLSHLGSTQIIHLLFHLLTASTRSVSTTFHLAVPETNDFTGFFHRCSLGPK